MLPVRTSSVLAAQAPAGTHGSSTYAGGYTVQDITRAQLLGAELAEDDCTIEAASVPTRPLISNYLPALLR